MLASVCPTTFLAGAFLVEAVVFLVAVLVVFLVRDAVVLVFGLAASTEFATASAFGATSLAMLFLSTVAIELSESFICSPYL